MNANIERLVDGAVDIHTKVASTRDFKRGVRALIAEAYRMGSHDAEAAHAKTAEGSRETRPLAETTDSTEASQSAPSSVLDPVGATSRAAPTIPAVAPSQPVVRPSTGGIAQTAQTVAAEQGQARAERQRAAEATARL